MVCACPGGLFIQLRLRGAGGFFPAVDKAGVPPTPLMHISPTRAARAAFFWSKSQHVYTATTNSGASFFTYGGIYRRGMVVVVVVMVVVVVSNHTTPTERHEK